MYLHATADTAPHEVQETPQVGARNGETLSELMSQGAFATSFGVEHAATLAGVAGRCGAILAVHHRLLTADELL